MAAILIGLTLERFPARDQAELCVAITLADAADSDGTNVYPSVPRIAKLARCGERSVQYALQRFREIGFLVVVTLGGGRGRPTKYRIDRAWLESQASVLPKKENGAPHAPIPKTVHHDKKPRSKDAETQQKGCTDGATAGAPNPPPLTPDPKPPHHARTREGVVGGDEAMEKPKLTQEEADALTEAAVADYKRSGKEIRSESGLRNWIRDRLARGELDEVDRARLDALRREARKRVALATLAPGRYVTKAGSVVTISVGTNTVLIEPPTGKSISKTLEAITEQVATGQIQLTRAPAPTPALRVGDDLLAGLNKTPTRRADTRKGVGNDKPI